MKRQLIVIIATLFSAFVINAQEPAAVQSVEIVDHGIYKIELTGERVPMPSAGAGGVRPASRAVLIAATNQIPAVIGTTFGCHFIVRGQPEGAVADLTIMVRHPSFKKPDGQVTGPLDAVSWRYRIGEVAGYTYTFDHEWEALPGKWSIEVWRNGEKLAGEDFQVTSKDK